jgi:hypothetical protein
MKATTVGVMSGMTSAPSAAVAEAEPRSRGSDAILPAREENGA